MIKNIEFKQGSGNVFADLGLNNAEELQARGMIGAHIVELLKSKGLKQKEISNLLGIKQVEVSHLLNGHFSRFSIDKLLDFLKSILYSFLIKEEILIKY